MDKEGLIITLVFVGFIWIVLPAIQISRYYYYYIQREKACNPDEVTKKKIIKCVINGAVWLFLKILINPRSNTIWIDSSIKEFKRDTEVIPLIRRKCEAKLPDAPNWRCTCGRENPSHTSTCVCGVNMRDIPPEVRKIPEEAIWKCACGRENIERDAVCICGREKKNLASEIRSPGAVPKGSWRCSCGRENPNYTTTCVCGAHKGNAQKKETKKEGES